MNFIRNTRIRTMMILILVLFSFLWGGVSIFALYSLNQLTSEIDLTNVQQNNGDIINGASGQYYRVKNSMDRAVEAREKNNTEAFMQELQASSADIDKLKAGLQEFQVVDHGNIDPKTVDIIYNSSYELFSKAIVPMYDAVKAERFDEFKQLSSVQYRDLRRNFTTAIDQYNGVIARLKNEAQSRIADWVSWCQKMLIAALVAGLIIVLLTDRYLAQFVIRPLDLIKQHLQVLSVGQLHTYLEQSGKNCVGKLIPFVQQMQDNWVKTVSDIRSSAEQIYRSSGEIASGNTDLPSRTEEHASE